MLLIPVLRELSLVAPVINQVSRVTPQSLLTLTSFIVIKAEHEKVSVGFSISFDIVTVKLQDESIIVVLQGCPYNNLPEFNKIKMNNNNFRFFRTISPAYKAPSEQALCSLPGKTAIIFIKILKISNLLFMNLPILILFLVHNILTQFSKNTKSSLVITFFRIKGLLFVYLLVDW